MSPHEMKDENGSVWIASVKTYGDTTHTFVDRSKYNGYFLPGSKAHYLKEAFNRLAKPVELQLVDHVVGNQPDGEMEGVVKYYQNCLDFIDFGRSMTKLSIRSLRL